MAAHKELSDQEKVRVAYARLFSTRDGEVVLEDLCRLFYDGPMRDKDGLLERLVGQRDVVYHIKQRVKNARIE